jgi:hypothetical protein
MSGPALQMDDDKTIIPPDPREHRRQQKIARQQHIEQTLRRLRDSDDLFLNNSITLAEDEQTSLAKDDISNKKCLAINAAHTKRGTPSTGIAQRGRNAAYRETPPPPLFSPMHRSSQKGKVNLQKIIFDAQYVLYLQYNILSHNNIFFCDLI